MIMKVSLKALSTLLISAAILFQACDKTKEEDHSRDDFAATESLGIFKDGKPVLTFLKNSHQYYCNPKAGVLRIIDNEGTRDVTIKLSAMPSSSRKVEGSLSGNMGVTAFSFSELEILKIDSRTVWLWSDKDKVGMILPSAGMQDSK